MAIAALSAGPSAAGMPGCEPLGTAACSLLLTDSESDEQRVQLLPDGLFKAGDGRPQDVPHGQWLLDEAAWQSIRAHAAARHNDYPADYEHQTLRTEENGQPAPASGWFAPASLAYVPGEGLFANAVRWTPKAREFIRNKEYRFISAVFAYDKATGRVQELLHMALTNNPALDGMKAIAALSQGFSTLDSTTQPQQGDIAMNEATRLLAALGISTEGIDLNDASAVKGLIDSGLAACTALKAKADKADALNTEVAALKSQTSKGAGAVDPAQFVPIAAFNELQTQVAALSKQTGVDAVNTAIDKAAKAGKVYGQADRDWLTQVGAESGIAALTSLLTGRAAIAALTATQTTQAGAPDADKGLAVLSADDKAVADQLGISHADFAKQKKG